MKKIAFVLTLCVAVTFTACNDDEQPGEFADYLVARPLTLSIDEFKNSVDVIPPIPIDESGKIYAYNDLIFVNDKFKGVHVIDNSDPSSPQKISFIKIAGNVDISVKDNFLYADSLMDLIVIDISDLNNIQIVNRLENVLQDNVVWPAEAEIFEFEEIDYENEILVGWEVVTERRRVEDVQVLLNDLAFAEAADAGNTGQGGSLARFKIVDSFLYAVDSHFINVFNITDLANPIVLDDVYAGFDIETIFNRGEHLFLGSMRGMYIYDITDPAAPTFVSEFEHGTACDPVVVDGDYAYVTLRGGNNCGALESGLFIVDISTITNPELKTIYPMDDPYGLGIKDEKLFICDGSSGLKVYDKSDVEDLVMLDHFENIVTFDVIPLQDHLLMVGDEILYQYEYVPAGIELISELDLN